MTRQQEAKQQEAGSPPLPASRSTLPTLRPYQLDVARAVLASVRQGQGLTFTVEVSRQGGKNELSAQLELLLLTLYMARGGDAVKAAPTFRPQCLISLARLRDRLNQAGYKGHWHTDHGYGIRLGHARQLFLSAVPEASVVGHTASILLEIDEAQDVHPDRYAKDFRPMGASTNVTTVLWGTPWDDLCLLEQVKQSNLQLQLADGIQRHFRYDWQVVARGNPAYRSYVENERARLGEDHPLFQTQYLLNPLGRSGRLFTTQQLQQLAGDHPPRSAPSQHLHVAGLDIAGADEDIDDITLANTARDRDSTVLTVAELVPTQDPLFPQPVIRVVHHFADVGTKHAQLYPKLLDLVRNWKVKRLFVDATGIGAGVASYLRHTLGPLVQPFLFSAPSKSQLAFEVLAAVNAGRLKMYTGALAEALEFWRQARAARTAVRPNKTMNFYVDPRDGHDDYLMSLALCAHAAGDAPPRQAKGSLRP